MDGPPLTADPDGVTVSHGRFDEPVQGTAMLLGLVTTTVAELAVFSSSRKVKLAWLKRSRGETVK